MYVNDVIQQYVQSGLVSMSRHLSKNEQQRTP